MKTTEIIFDDSTKEYSFTVFSKNIHAINMIQKWVSA